MNTDSTAYRYLVFIALTITLKIAQSVINGLTGFQSPRPFWQFMTYDFSAFMVGVACARLLWKS